jgi:DnaJ-domain-containing protein 1
MTDCFALLNEPRRPWVDPEVIKEKFIVLSTAVHPDRVHNAVEVEKQAAQRQYTEINAAYNCLREPKTRLQHLLELELGVRPQQVQSIPPDLMDLSMEIGQLCREVDRFLAEKTRTTSPLLRVQVFERSQGWTEKAGTLRNQITCRQEALATELKTLDADWVVGEDPHSAHRQAVLQRLEELYRLFGYCARWSSQLQERIVQLSF